MQYVKNVLTAGLFVVGCSASSAVRPADGGSATGDGSAATTVGGPGSDAGSCGGGPAAWEEDGVLHCGTSGEAILSANTSRNPLDGGPLVYTSLEVVISQGAAPYIFSFIVTTSDALGGSYTCVVGPTSGVQLTYDDVGVFSSTTSSCSVSVTLTPTDGGMIATGSFSAQLALTDGGVKTLSNGTFTFAVTNG